MPMLHIGKQVLELLAVDCLGEITLLRDENKSATGMSLVGVD